MEYMSAREAAEKWGVSLRYAQRLLSENRIPGARKYGVSWMIPADSEWSPEPRGDAPRRSGYAFFPIIHLHNGDMERAFRLCGSDEERVLLEAQLAFFRCEPQRARELATSLYKTAAEAEIRLGCGIVIALACAYLGNLSLWRATYSELEVMPLPESAQAEREMALALLSLAMHGKNVCPEWLDRGCFDALPPELFPLARYLYVKNLYIKWREVDLLAVVEPLLSECLREKSDLASVHLHILAAVAYNDLGKTARSKEHIFAAADIAMPLELTSPFADYWHTLGRVMDACLGERYPEKLAGLKKRALPFWDIWARMYSDLWSQPMVRGLTPRELEAARLVQRGLTTNEVARRMGISVSSVKKYLNVAYSKMNVERKADLKTLIHT